MKENAEVAEERSRVLAKQAALKVGETTAADVYQTIYIYYLHDMCRACGWVCSSRVISYILLLKYASTQRAQPTAAVVYTEERICILQPI